MTQPDIIGADPVGPPARRGQLAWVREADWGSAALAAAAILLAALIGGLLVVLSGWLIAPHQAEPVADVFGLETFARATALSVCTAFFGGAVASAGDQAGGFFNGGQISVHVTPLGTTALVIATTWFVVRRGVRGAAADRRGFAGLVTALLTVAMLIVALLARLTTDAAGASLHANIVETVIGTLLVVGVTAMLAAGPTERPLADLLGRWVLLIRAALAGVAVACAAGWLAVVVSALLETNAADDSLVDTLRLLPASIAYLPNLGLSAAHVGLLGSLSASVGAFFGGGLDLSLLERHGLSAWYWLYVLIPLAAAGTALRWAARGVGDADDRLAEVRRSLLLLAAPFAGLWLLVALCARIRASVGGLSASAGITLWQALVLPALLIGLLALLLAAPLAARGTARIGTRRQKSSLTPLTLVLGYVVIALLLAAGSALADRGDGVGDLGDPFSLVSESSSDSVSVGAVETAPGIPSTCTPGDAYCSSLTVLPPTMLPDLGQLDTAQESYQAEHGRYADDVAALADYGFLPGSDRVLTIVHAGSDSYCATTAPAGAPDEAFSVIRSGGSASFVRGDAC